MLKSIVKKILAIFHWELRKTTSSKGKKTFWDVKHPIYVYNNKTGQEDPLQEFQTVGRLLKNGREKDYPDSNIEFGDFTYGNPRIWNWDKRADCKIGKYCSIAFGTTILIGGEHCMEWMTTYPFSAFVNSFINTPPPPPIRITVYT
ncbi:MAG: hypothetical protein LBU25_07360 [Treponema sp.]|nr:hypothetical protein [Treponema sp.]